jgi:uncharacterized OsmC-like protein
VKITLLDEYRLRYEPAPGPLTIDALAPDAQVTPYQLVAGGLASCTWSILASWAEQAKLSVDDLVVEVAWGFVEKPHRLGNLDLRFEWPSLPAARLEAAKRVAARCPVHVSFEHAPTLGIDGTAGDAEPDAATSGAAAPEAQAVAPPTPSAPAASASAASASAASAAPAISA